MSKVLKLYNTFTKSLNTVELSGKVISPHSIATGQPINASLYICGPTVYSDCHLGHALTYIRADLFRRFMRSFFNVRLNTVMNITDIDDKILAKAQQICQTTTSDANNYNNQFSFSSEPSRHNFNLISEKYYKSFLSDMESIRVLPADLSIKVSQHIHLITEFIRKLESDGHAQISSNGDVHFIVNSLTNYVGRTDKRQEPLDVGKLKSDPRDFVLWKVAKPNEPIWYYKSSVSDKCIPGRPGWHVQCSAISSAIFGNNLDFHFGGKDLIFPHHYNEEACCCAYHSLDTTKSLHVWANNWLHSGHLIMKDVKMSKSLGNVIAIKNFINRSSVNALRLLCVYSHYRSDFEYNQELLDRLEALDHKISAFVGFLTKSLRNAQQNISPLNDEQVLPESEEIEQAILSTHNDIIEGVCDDFHLNRGLESILNLSKLLYSKDASQLKPKDLIASWSLVKDWCETCGLDYGGLSNSSAISTSLFELLSDFRFKVRSLTLENLRATQDADGITKARLGKILRECDNIRTRMDDLGFVARDPKS